MVQLPPLAFLQTRKFTRIMIAISPQIPDSIAHTPYAIQACLLTAGRTAYKYHLFTFPHYSSRGSSVQNWNTRSTQCLQAHTVVLISLGNRSRKLILVWRGPTFLPSDFPQPSMTFRCLSISKLSVFYGM